MHTTTTKLGAGLRRAVTVAVAAAALSTVSGLALAGQCPAGKMGKDLMKPSNAMAKDVTDNVLASIQLAQHIQGLDGRQMRLRELVVQPGGVVPWHSHDDRPALIYILSGSITEYSNTCAVPIEHKVGEVAPESVGLGHWWKNNGKVAVRLLAADIARAQ